MSELRPEDRAALADLVAAYATAVDARSWPAVAALFTADALLSTPDPPRSLEPVLQARGHEQILATIGAVGAFARTEHLITTTEWRREGAVAYGHTTGAAHHVVDGPEPHAWVWHVEYDDECVRDQGRWRFATRALTVRRIEKRPLP